MGTQSEGRVWGDEAAALLVEEHLVLLRAGPEPERHSLHIGPVGACCLTKRAFPYSQGSQQAQDSRERLSASSAGSPAPSWKLFLPIVKLGRAVLGKGGSNTQKRRNRA